MTTLYKLRNRWEVVQQTDTGIRGYRTPDTNKALKVAMRWAGKGKLEIVLCAGSTVGKGV